MPGQVIQLVAPEASHLFFEMEATGPMLLPLQDVTARAVFSIQAGSALGKNAAAGVMLDSEFPVAWRPSSSLISAARPDACAFNVGA